MFDNFHVKLCQRKTKVHFLWSRVFFHVSIYENFIVVPVDNASNNYYIANLWLKEVYLSILVEELEHYLNPVNPTYNLTDFPISY